MAHLIHVTPGKKAMGKRMSKNLYLFSTKHAKSLSVSEIEIAVIIL